MNSASLPSAPRLTILEMVSSSPPVPAAGKRPGRASGICRRPSWSPPFPGPPVEWRRARDRTRREIWPREAPPGVMRAGPNPGRLIGNGSRSASIHATARSSMPVKCDTKVKARPNCRESARMGAYSVLQVTDRLRRGGGPPINAEQRGRKTEPLSALICVYRRPSNGFWHPAGCLALGGREADWRLSTGVECARASQHAVRLQR